MLWQRGGGYHVVAAWLLCGGYVLAVCSLCAAEEEGGVGEAPLETRRGLLRRAVGAWKEVQLAQIPGSTKGD